MSDTFTCKNCQKRTEAKDGIQGDGHPYFVRCEHCNAKHELLPAPSESLGPKNFTAGPLIE